MPSKKLFLASTTILFVLVSFPLISLVGASSEMWSQTYGGTGGDLAYSLVETSDEGFALAGKTTSFGAGSSDFWLVKTDANGIPEFPSWIILPLFLMATLVGVIIRNKIGKKGLE